MEQTSINKSNSNINKDKSYLQGRLSEEQVISLIKDGKVETVTVISSNVVHTFFKRFDSENFLNNVLKQGFKTPLINTSLNIINNIVETESIGFHTTNDLNVKIDKNTYRKLSWIGPEHVLVFGDFVDSENNLHALWPRNILKKLLLKAEKQDKIKFMAGTELEYYIFKTKNSNIIKDYPKFDLSEHTMGNRIGDFQIASITDNFEDLNKEIRKHIKGSGIELEGIMNEQGPGQQEINVKYGDILEICDNHVLIKQCIRHVANKNGYGSSFMAKTIIDRDGSSSHVHISLYDSETNKNLFSTINSKEEEYNLNLPELEKCNIKMIYFIGGILKHLKDLFLIYAPNVNSYKRFQKDSFAAFYINTWSYDSRTSTVRIVGNGDSLHLEIRLAGADANPYLLLTTIIGSGLDGLKNSILPNKIVRGNVYLQKDDDFEIAPNNLYEAVQIFDNAKIAEDLFGKEYKNLLSAMAKKEWHDFCNHISNFEINRYIEYC